MLILYAQSIKHEAASILLIFDHRDPAAMSIQDGGETGIDIHDDSDQAPQPVGTYDPYYIGTLSQPFCPMASISKRVFHNLHQEVFGAALLRCFNMHPSVLSGEASRHFHLAVLRNTTDISLQQSLSSLKDEIGARGPTRLLSMWKKCSLGFFLEAEILDPVTFVFNPAISAAIAMANQVGTAFEWLHVRDIGLGQRFSYQAPLPYCLLAEFLSSPKFFGNALRNELQSTRSIRSLVCPAALSNMRFSLACVIIVLHRAFKGQWNWALIQAFDPLYAQELATDAETAGFLTDVHIMAGDLVAAGEIVRGQLKDAVNLAMRKTDPAMYLACS
ncbi:hypothetical protein DEU56DRAFT_908512 [Suillus clintonianus]|uniref:uncharacterized protein n=1 Tax=Suillus clintonianus TaxID=1904413 RepID=UPI001B86431D|nr:uncharacterized protein DEU56DRAFT_908512 [Suillus clintonianus]KAG2150873.1 hypothetical protein DEU56DRAFT_908512 [Suillus clintonianus]